jgi:hypothetical protein
LHLLGSAAKTELQAFWRSFPEAMPQYADEARHFSVWLEGRIGPGECLDMLHAELTAYEGQLGELGGANRFAIETAAMGRGAMEELNK